MATPLSKKPVLTIDEQIAELKAKRAAELEKEIKQLELSAQVDDARFELSQKIKSEWNILKKKIDDEEKELSKKHKQEENLLIQNIGEYKDEFKEKYGVDFEIKRPEIKVVLALRAKARLISELKVGDAPKYKLNDDKTALIGAKGQPITSTINEKIDGKKETLSARNLFKYLKPEATKEELDKLFPPKNNLPKEYSSQSIIKTDLGGDLGKL
ncbi:hypothetical protein [Flavobacterium muglaense]|uniref:Uncharacterized protein n=1 Tax=Flavobacterium muglaense TaxID=2764716 RepID=A0A923N044_9FLAO|nr:hypothetical protein [Flavobacterium muglaense]MBC5836772.1 hypothetical protein [Flavobacterium muglaense]MBC5843278.1 hypothetical protein [Flavobacterium muglaense]